MMDSEYLKQKYITTGLATTFHRALLADYFRLSERDMEIMGMTVVAWGFSYQVTGLMDFYETRFLCHKLKDENKAIEL